VAPCFRQCQKTNPDDREIDHSRLSMQLRLPRADASDKDTLPAQIYGKSKNATTPYVRTQHLFPDCVAAIHIQFDLSPCAYCSTIRDGADAFFNVTSAVARPETEARSRAFVAPGGCWIGRTGAQGFAAFRANGPRDLREG